MSWQEELRRLDQELAAGQISADDYRVRRDNVLSSAVNADPQNQQPQQGTGNADSTQIIAPVSGPPQQQPPAPGPSADSTQIVGNADTSGERTQAVRPSWQTAQPGQGDADRTQVVPGVPPQQVAGGYPGGPASPSGGFPAQQQPRQQQPVWNSPSADASPPWGGGDFPPIAPSSSHEWVGQGPEVFGEPSGSKKKIIAIVVAVVVLAGLGVGAFFLFSNKSDDTTPPTASQSNQPPASSAKPKDNLEIAKLPGTVAEVTDFPQFSEVTARKVLTDDENAAYTTAGAEKSRLAVSNLPSSISAVVLTSESSSPNAATIARDKLVELQIKYGLQYYSGATPPGVKVTQLNKVEGGKALIRAHYAHKNTIVRLHVEGNDLTEISRVFDEILAAQLQALPADNS
ncbi:hypothetical protein [Amycolatopsis anabasis]|uniref:hypothetical protein n=1 Tax=Amycolatopsis anabasis TaxID=1840409 RepID=UPI001FE3BD69|nr:hypothetical protein [Amycolatopsis anabasis]